MDELGKIMLQNVYPYFCLKTTKHFLHLASRKDKYCRYIIKEIHY